MKWYTLELPYFTKHDIEAVGTFRIWLYENGMKHLTARNGDRMQFSIRMNAGQVFRVKEFVDALTGKGMRRPYGRCSRRPEWYRAEV